MNALESAKSLFTYKCPKPKGIYSDSQPDSNTLEYQALRIKTSRSDSPSKRMGLRT